MQAFSFKRRLPNVKERYSAHIAVRVVSIAVCNGQQIITCGASSAVDVNPSQQASRATEALCTDENLIDLKQK
eukprot:IDg6008t1